MLLSWHTRDDPGNILSGLALKKPTPLYSGNFGVTCHLEIIYITHKLTNNSEEPEAKG